MDNLMDQDLYELIGTVSTATIKEIKTAYRKTALSCHPDKNPDNPKAAELFHQLSSALEILTDESARAAYDKVLNAKHQAKLRTKQLDSKRKKLKEDLEAREEAYRNSQKHGDVKSDEQKLQAEIERLRKVGSKQVEEEIAFVRQQVMEELHKMRASDRDSESSDPNEHRLKIKWAATENDLKNGGYDYNTLHRILSKYGDIAILVVSSNKTGRALVEYTSKDAAVRPILILNLSYVHTTYTIQITDIGLAEMAVQIEQGLSNNPLRLEWVCKPKKKATCSAPNVPSSLPQSRTLLFPVQDVSANAPGSNFPSYSSAPDMFNLRSKISDLEFESSVLSNLRRAEERKRLIEKLSQEDG
ncbi:dnaJ homolog subfamily C member 17 isoform X1 [Athalia rosae]|uniref:dnaJ homolog subfamily C member 17 isoform X1 n=1 Tax=Athalia rosae TaxID=37344 RepID=UPI0020339055|nr:dnaJ homolog subfamily C member 17 isoform X1 [Athalia rosae]